MLYGIYSCDNNVEYHTLFFKYAHGNLEKLLQHDVLVSKTNEEFKKFEQVKDKEIFDVKVMLPNKDVLPCKAFIWREGSFLYNKGLIVLEDDIEGLKYAMDCYVNSKMII